MRHAINVAHGGVHRKTLGRPGGKPSPIPKCTSCADRAVDRAAIGEGFGLAPARRPLGNVTALRRLGFDRVFDTDFAPT